MRVELRRIAVDVPLVVDNMDIAQSRSMHALGSSVLWLESLVISHDDGF